MWVQALDAGGNFSEVAAGHKRRCQQEFENYLHQLVPWLQSNEPPESFRAVLDEIEVWRTSSVSQRLDFSTGAGEADSAEATDVPSAMCGNNLQAGADGGDTEELDEEVDELQVQKFSVMSTCLPTATSKANT